MQEMMCPFCLKAVQTDICPHCGGDVHYSGYPGHLPVGYTLQGRGVYILGSYIGQGGFGITYIALDVTTNQRVAIKEYYPSHCCIRNSSTYVHPGAGQEETYSKGKQHFLREAQMLQSLSDLDSVVKVLDYFEANNTAYLVMEYLDGLSLKDHVEQNGKLPAQSFLIQMKPLMADMEKMHQRGVVHRDIAPDNIILLKDSRLKLIDFGAARSYVGDKSMTVVVKKGFAPVEQYMRKGSNASTDVYALAATVYYCITGIIPPDSAERQYGDAELKAPTSLGVELSREQERGLEKALEIQPKARTQSVTELINALSHIPRAILQKQEEERRQQEKLRKKQEDERRRQELLQKKQEEDRRRQEMLLKKQEEDRRRKEALRKKREEDRRQREKRQENQADLPDRQEKTNSGKSGKRFALVAAAVVVVLAGALLIPRFMDKGDVSLSVRETEVPSTDSVKTQPEQELSPEARRYNEAVDFFEDKEYGKAAIAFGKLGDYRDAKELSRQIWDAIADRKTITATNGCTMAIREDGTVVACGRYAPNVTKVTDAVSLASTYWTTWVLRNDGTVLQMGYNHGRRDTSQLEWTDIVAINMSLGQDCLVGLKADGTLVSLNFVYNNVGPEESSAASEKYENLHSVVEYDDLSGFVRLADGTMLVNHELLKDQDVVDVCGSYSGIAKLRSDGTVDFEIHHLKGNFDQVQAAQMKTDMSGWEDIISITGNGTNAIYGIKSDGTVVAAGDNSGARPLDVHKWTDVVDVVSGGSHSVGLRADGTLVTAGSEMQNERQTYGMDNIRLPADRDALLSRIHPEYITDEDVPPEAQPTTAETKPAVDTYYIAASESYSSAEESMRANLFFWGQTKWQRKDIRTIVFVNSLDDAPSDAVDISAAQDGSVLAWMKGFGNLVVGADGNIAPDPELKEMFSYFVNLKQIDFGTCFDTSDVTDMSSMFYNCKYLKELDLSCFDTSKVTHMSSMFSQCKFLTSLDLSSFDTSNVTYVADMFSGCTYIKKLDLSSFDTSGVTLMNGMFAGCEMLEELNLSNFDTSNVRTIYAMFSDCKSLAALDLSSFNTSQVTSMAYAFSGCESLEELDLSGFDTSDVGYMGSMFEHCKSLTALDLKSFDTSNVTSVARLFYGCQMLKNLDLSSFDVSNVTNFEDMFEHCPAKRPNWYRK